MKKKLLFSLIILSFLCGTVCFATNDISLSTDLPIDDVATAGTQEILNEDLFVGEKTTYNLNTKVLGNVFSVSDNFNMGDISYVDGNLFIVSKNATLKSNVNYSEKDSKDGGKEINKIVSNSQVKGNAFVVAESFTLESGSTIDGDLFIVAEKITINKSCIIRGNVFIVGQNVTIDGKISGSAYIGATEFKMGYYGSIAKDLNLTSTNATLNNVVGRNANIEATTLNLSSDFKCDGDLKVTGTNISFAGNIKGNASIYATNLEFNIGENGTCKIGKDLTYSCTEKLDVESLNIVVGAVNYTEYIEKVTNFNTAFSIKNFILNMLKYIVFVYVICLFVKFIFPKYLEKEHCLDFKSLAKAFGVGFLSFILILPAFILLLVTIIGIPLAFVLIFIYIAICIMAIPVLIFDISKAFKHKLNIYALFGIIPFVYYLLKAIPILGGIISFLAFTIGIGRILYSIFTRK